MITKQTFKKSNFTRIITSLLVLCVLVFLVSCKTVSHGSKANSRALTQAKLDYYNEYVEYENSNTPYKYPDNMSELNFVVFDPEKLIMSYIYTIYLHREDRTEEQWKNIRYSLITTVSKNIKTFHDELYESFRKDGMTLRYYYTDLDDNLIHGLEFKPGEY